MKFFRIHLRASDGQSHGYKFETSEGAANRVVRHWERDMGKGTATAEPLVIAPSKGAILAALTRFASHPDNG